MWGSSLVMSAALRQKERVRDTLLASGAVWSAHENVARRMGGRAEEQRMVDALSGEKSGPRCFGACML